MTELNVCKDLSAQGLTRSRSHHTSQGEVTVVGIRGLD